MADRDFTGAWYAIDDLRRNVQTLEDEVRKTRAELQMLREAEEIGQAVAEELRKRGPVIPLGWLAKLAAAAVTLLSIATFVQSLLRK